MTTAPKRLLCFAHEMSTLAVTYGPLDSTNPSITRPRPHKEQPKFLSLDQLIEASPETAILSPRGDPEILAAVATRFGNWKASKLAEHLGYVDHAIHFADKFNSLQSRDPAFGEASPEEYKAARRARTAETRTALNATLQALLDNLPHTPFGGRTDPLACFNKAAGRMIGLYTSQSGQTTLEPETGLFRSSLTTAFTYLLGTRFSMLWASLEGEEPLDVLDGILAPPRNNLWTQMQDDDLLLGHLRAFKPARGGTVALALRLNPAGSEEGRRTVRLAQDGNLLETSYGSGQDFRAHIDEILDDFLAPARNHLAMRESSALWPAAAKTIQLPKARYNNQPPKPKDPSVVSDPLLWLHHVADWMGLKLNFEYKHSSSDDYADTGNTILIGDCSNSFRKGQEKHNLSIWVEYNVPSGQKSGKAHQQFLDFLDGDGRVSGRLFRELTFRNPLSSYERYFRNIKLNIDYYVKRPQHQSDDYCVLHVDLAQAALGQFVVERVNFTNDTSPIQNYSAETHKQHRANYKFFGGDDLAAAGPDFRPYLHRMLELYRGVLRRAWHDPRQYLTQDAPYPDALNRALALLFPEELDARTGRLSLRDGFASVPRLNLGAVQLPAPGLATLADSEFVQHGAPLVIEYLSTRMDRRQAEALVEQRVTQYYLHRVQKSRTDAHRLLGGLRASEAAHG